MQLPLSLNVLIIHTKQPNSLVHMYAVLKDNGCIC